MRLLPSYDPTLPHAEQLAAIERIFKGAKVKLPVGCAVDGGRAFTPKRRFLKRKQTVRVSAVSIGIEGIFLNFGRGEGRWWVDATDVVEIVSDRSPWPLRASPLAA